MKRTYGLRAKARAVTRDVYCVVLIVLPPCWNATPDEQERCLSVSVSLTARVRLMLPGDDGGPQASDEGDRGGERSERDNGLVRDRTHLITSRVTPHLYPPTSAPPQYSELSSERTFALGPPPHSTKSSLPATCAAYLRMMPEGECTCSGRDWEGVPVAVYSATEGRVGWC